MKNFTKVALGILLISKLSLADGKIPQDAIHFTELVAGDLIPAAEGDEAGISALKKARSSFSTNCDAWKKAQKDLAGKNFLWAECGNEIKGIPVYAGGYTESPFGKGGKAIGWIAFSTGTVVFEAPAGRLKSISVPPVTSELAPYQLLEPTTLKLEALKKNIEQYRKRCDEWRTTIRAEMQDNFVYASCDGVKGELQDHKKSGIRIIDNLPTRSLRITGQPAHSKVYYVVDLEEE